MAFQEKNQYEKPKSDKVKIPHEVLDKEINIIKAKMRADECVNKFKNKLSTLGFVTPIPSNNSSTKNPFAALNGPQFDELKDVYQLIVRDRYLKHIKQILDLAKLKYVDDEYINDAAKFIYTFIQEPQPVKHYTTMFKELDYLLTSSNGSNFINDLLSNTE